jgi:uncharacterized protein (TIGR00369 family)
MLPGTNQAIIEEIIAASPFARLLGIRLGGFAPDQAKIELPFRTEMATVGQVIHGGAIASLVDIAAAAAAWSNADPEAKRRGVTIGFSINYLAAASGTDLVATARVIRRGRQIVVCDVTASDPAGEPVAKALVTYKIG